MRERLREVAELAPERRVVFLGQQTDIVGKPAQAPEQCACFVGGSDIMRQVYQSGELQKVLEGVKQSA